MNSLKLGLGGGCYIDMYHVYVLKSEKNGKRYVGYTQKDPAERL